VHGTVTMAATVSEEWPPQDRSRITLLELLPFVDRPKDVSPAPPEEVASMLQAASEMSAALRARAIATWDLFLRNLKAARAAIMAMGGSPRDADQLGHLIAGWKTMTSDDELGDADQLARFRPFIMSLTENEDGDDAPNDLLNILFSSAPDMWRSGERLTIGQLIARARSDDPDAGQWRRALEPNGLKLVKRDDESWREAWLWVANKHEGLEKLFASHPTYRGKKRAQILSQLRGTVDGVEWRAQRSAPTDRTRFAGAQSRYLMLPPVFLPGAGDE
jgi:hypothetical protein